MGGLDDKPTAQIPARTGQNKTLAHDERVATLNLDRQSMADEFERAGSIHIFIRIIEIGGEVPVRALLPEQELQQFDCLRPQGSVRFEDKGAELCTISPSRGSKFLSLALLPRLGCIQGSTSSVELVGSSSWVDSRHIYVDHSVRANKSDIRSAAILPLEVSVLLHIGQIQQGRRLTEQITDEIMAEGDRMTLEFRTGEEVRQERR